MRIMWRVTRDFTSLSTNMNRLSTALSATQPVNIPLPKSCPSPFSMITSSNTNNDQLIETSPTNSSPSSLLTPINSLSPLSVHTPNINSPATPSSSVFSPALFTNLPNLVSVSNSDDSDYISATASTTMTTTTLLK
ncbi:hypothetical protein PILCRDRAFT_2719 [Piloderma croceum F 1598]|uniref:Uncharacterized protein n=1 Tax=Piloderma croceum (strain F 1598) TaxID=765440 RepID=A0A0C3GCU3_PILCF|nr:hypothetical protein PILCRDRAFT_2719 [Piloderma croceum F 1598]